ncbi:intercellular adhesin biosynthesis polysaccharide N-deacetylase [Phocicoccus pinnipedialis]|uniref:Poly-beta-1,6-N-acetyl-D-glucosamine N-deacetylase n=1 Tax=Phocicoccus pinnipedialis TaxID=110845 RepID=A0A6V7RNH8_9BACL|nr:intercellular adhesin biosynthesis polysaccharide N-deacetylase [Jeotgalicoccus pinnipedialis]MBP1940229.1 intercellular adhesin biosynthesis polysaccharide N-deacetylase [Jeotgalicoccus pinnipedialis]CAD2079598.1 Poly-beta-1,6-N-acetyl-D-glucosamine N-deacetylase [Jeotgalicoccus pinnipedialis]
MKKWINIIFIITLLLSGQHDAKAKETEQECLALNYHRLVKDNWFTKVVSLMTSNKELNLYSIKVPDFEKQMDWLIAHNATFVTEQELMKYKSNGAFPKRCVWVNFDDMDQSTLKLAHPLLKERHIPATGFVITGHVGDASFHNFKLISLQSLKDMEASGIWHFNSHTHDLHNIKNDTSDLINRHGEMPLDLNTSASYIKDNFSTSVLSLAYPYGQYDDDTIKYLRGSEFRHAYVLKDVPINVDDDNYTLPRILMTRDSFDKIVKKWDGFN